MSSSTCILCRDVIAGDVYRGARGGLREVHSWDDNEYSRYADMIAHRGSYAAPGAGRSIYLLFGAAKAGRRVWLPDFERWLASATLVERGVGMPWPYADCPECFGGGIVGAAWATQEWVTCSTCKAASWEVPNG